MRRVRRGFLGKILGKERNHLYTYITYYSEGRDVPVGILGKVREELKLDHRSGVDAIAFYSKDPIQATEFIVRYKRTLKRLSRF